MKATAKLPSVGGLLEIKARRNKNKPFCYYQDQVVTYRELDEQANRVSNAFQQMGFNKGDHVCLLLSNCPDFLYAMFGLAKAGIVEVPLNTAHKGNILKRMINHSDAKIMIVDKSFLGSIKLIEDELTTLERLVVYPDNRGIPKVNLEVVSWEEILNQPPTKPSVEVKGQDTFAILYTSGTTGLSKGAIAPHNQLCWLGERRVGEVRLTSEDIVYVCFPLFHIAAQGACVMSALAADASIALVERFSAGSFWDDIKRFRATFSIGFSQQIQILYNQPERPDDADNPLKCILVALVPKAIHRPFEKRFGLILIDEYGMTEADAICYQDYDEREVGSCGSEKPDFELKILDDNDNEVPPRVPGEIAIRPQKPFIMMQGYYKDPEATLRVFRNLWFHTGDLAYKDEKGLIYFVDRKKDAIRRRGENISSFELEGVINTHPRVATSAAVGVPSELGEDDVKVVVKLKERETLAPEQLLEFCEERMAYFMVPRYVEYVEEFPLTETAKIRKELLKTVTEKTWDREKAGYQLKRDVAKKGKAKQ